ncbi:c-type cytochrome [Pinisolibacter sp.]|uniref:c-type cytochrome n=1 Tax=Pinisolibacter sp. TaxID=2172024 RepID=UPI002FDE99F2
MSIRTTTLVSAALVAVIAAGTAFAADPIEARKKTMKAIGGSFGGVLVKMVKGETPYDAAAAKKAAATLNETAAGIDIAALFPKGSEKGGDTEALPAIWSDAAGFKAAMDKMKSTVAAQAGNVDQGADKLKMAVAEIGKTCKGCHDTYRAQKP